MKIIPAIDLRRGQCVRLLKGDFDQCTTYDKSPVDLVQYYEQLGFTELHIVDLDGALTGNPSNQRMIESVCTSTGMQVQIGGGVRSREVVAGWIDMGVSRCVIGSVAVDNPVEVKKWIEDFGADRFVLAFDVRHTNGEPRPAIDGWTRDTELTLWDWVAEYVAVGARRILCTDIERDGAMTGPSLSLYSDLMTRFPGIFLQASGGVRSVADLDSLAKVRASAAIVGRALLDGCIDEAELRSFLRAA